MRERKGLPTVLIRSDLGDDLRRHIAGREEAVGLLDHGLTDHRSVLQHILQVDEVAVMLLLRVVIGVVEVDHALLVRLYDILRKQEALREIPGDLPRHIVSLRGIDDRIFVRVLLLQLLIGLIDQG